MDEDVDIIDEENIVVGKTTKQEAHAKGALHRTAMAHVKDTKGRWLFVKQSSGRQDAGQYVLPMGGHVKAGETEEEALKRETLEELGLKDFKHRYIGKAIYNRYVLNRQENHYLILYEVISDAKPILNHESESYIYFTEEELKTELKHHPEHFGGAFHFVVKPFFPFLLA